MAYDYIYFITSIGTRCYSFALCFRYVCVNHLQNRLVQKRVISARDPREQLPSLTRRELGVADSERAYR